MCRANEAGSRIPRVQQITAPRNCAFFLKNEGRARRNGNLKYLNFLHHYGISHFKEVADPEQAAGFVGAKRKGLFFRTQIFEDAPQGQRSQFCFARKIEKKLPRGEIKKHF